MKKKFISVILAGCLISLFPINAMAKEQRYRVEFCDEVKTCYSLDEQDAILEEINADNAITVVFNDKVLEEYTSEELSEIRADVCQDVNDYLKERSSVKYVVKAEHDCYPTGPYADVYGGKNYIYDSQGNLIMYMQLGVCKYPPKRVCSRLVYKYTYV